MIYRIYNKIRSLLLSDYKKSKYYNSLKKIEDQIDNNKKNIFLLQTPTHGNLGDHAITIAILDFLYKNLNNNIYKIIEVNQTIHYEFLKFIKVKPTDIILLHGGGNFGDEYMREEEIRRSVFKLYKNNKIIQFPQTIYYSDTQEGKIEFEITNKLIELCNDLTLIAREKVSYDLMKKYYKRSNVILTPDIVLSSYKIDNSVERKGALMIMRTDNEKTLRNEDLLLIKNILSNRYENVTLSDMQYGKDIFKIEEREKALESKFKEFKSAEIVITDRLHGMVFAAITGTPCIAFSNYNQKVSGTYEWISNLNYVKFLEDINCLEETIVEMNCIKSKSIFDSTIYDTYFKNIITSINE